MKAASKFKNLIARNTSGILEGIFDKREIVAPPSSIQYRTVNTTRSGLANPPTKLAGTLAAEGIHGDIEINPDLSKADKTTEELEGGKEKVLATDNPQLQSGRQTSKEEIRPSPIPQSPNFHPRRIQTSPCASDPSITNIRTVTSLRSETGKGQAHDPLEDTLFLQIGAGSDDPPPDQYDIPVVSESPGAVDINVYERAYEEEIQKIIAARASEPIPRRPTLYLTKRVEGNKQIREHQAITDWSRSAATVASATAAAAADGAAWGLAKLTEVAKSGLDMPREMSKQASEVVQQIVQEKSKQIVAEIGCDKASQDLGVLDAVSASTTKSPTSETGST
jgi:[calcium/calmodulin-dependent protein kinase] kinase